LEADMDGEERGMLEEIRSGVKELKHKLYGISPTDKGDIGEIKDDVKGLCKDIGDCQETVDKEIRPRIVKLETVIKISAGVGGTGGVVAGILKGFNVF